MIGAPSNFHGCRRQGTDVAANFGKPDVFNCARSGLPASVDGSMNSYRLEPLAAAQTRDKQRDQR